MLKLQLSLLFVCCDFVLSHYSLYRSDIRNDSYPTFDCLYAYLLEGGRESGGRYVQNYQLTPYCRRPDSNEELLQDFEIPEENIEREITFDQLKADGITSEQLLALFAPIDLAERYEMNSHSSSTFYKCKSPWFGSRCQYKFNHDSSLSFSNIVDDTFKNYSSFIVRNPSGSCYQFLNSCQKEKWPRCLDWREICDGKNDCVSGEDEQGCEELEITKCADNEYRCHYGGQCIPLEFSKDSQLSVDCLDGSDEQNIYFAYAGIFNVYCVDVQTFRCQERTSRQPYTFQCSDGEYLASFALPSRISACSNRRDIEFSRSILTIFNHITNINCREALLCAIYYNRTQNSDMIGPVDIGPLETIMDHIWDKECEPLSQHCSTEWVVIPEYPMMFGFFQFVYLTNRTISEFQANPMPDFICFDGQKCLALLNLIIPINIIDGLVCCHASNLVQDIEYLDFYDFLSRFPKLSDHCTKLGVATSCPNSSYFHCNESLECIPYRRFGDGIFDCFYGEDETYSACHLNDSNRFICESDRNICLSPVVLGNGMTECPSGEDESRAYTNDLVKLLPFASLCDGIRNAATLSLNIEENDETNCAWWPCSNPYTRCDRYLHCPNGIDELGCSNTKCAPDEFQCGDFYVSDRYCLPRANLYDEYIDNCSESNIYRKVYFYNGTKDINNNYISWNNIQCNVLKYICHGSTRSSLTTDQLKTCLQQCIEDPRMCTQMVHFLENTQYTCVFDPEELHIVRVNLYLSSERLGNFPSIKDYHSIPIISKNNHQIKAFSKINTSFVTYCLRGVALLHGINQTIVCLCPPNYYGSRCEWQTQRVSLTLQFIWRNLTSTYVIFQAIAMIIDQDGLITPDYEEITYTPSRDCATKFNLYLLYPDRPKDTSRAYSIRIDLFDKKTLVYWASWHFPIQHPFLPVNRISTQLLIPNHAQKTASCSLSCGQHGKCVSYINKPSLSFCQCDQGYYGTRCELSYTCKCANDSFCHSPFICICPLHKFGSHCYLKHSICQGSNNPCQHNGICVPNDNRMYLEGITCICSKDYSGPRCENSNNRIEIHLDAKQLKDSSLLFIHFVTAFENAEHERTTLLKKVPYNRPILTIYLSQPFNILLVQIPNSSYYLGVLREKHIPSEHVHTLIQSKQCCMPIERLNNTLTNAPYLNRTKYYPLLCRQNLALSCFHDKDLICICDVDRFSNCFSFNHTMNYDCQGYNYCENGGQCFQNNETCPTESTCVCQDCYYGAKCQFSTKGFLFSLDPILAYHIKPHVPLTEQPVIIKISIVLSSLILSFGLINGFLCIAVYSRRKPRDIGSGYYLLISSILSTVMIIILTIKFWQLVLSQMFLLTNRSLLTFSCISIDYLLRILLASSEWLNACVAIERMVSVYVGTNFNKEKSRKYVKLAVSIILALTIITQVQDPMHRQLIDDIDDDEKRIWCLVQYSPSVRNYNAFITLFHFLVPFSMNGLATLLMIKKIARRRVNINPQQSYQAHFQRQVYRHQHLLYAPCMLIILSLPRLIISFSKRCMKSAHEPWLYLIGYFVSFIPSTLTFIVFILPSKNYKGELRLFYSATLRRLRRQL